jgi:hypothetical protein
MPSQQNGFSGAAMGAGPPKEPYTESGSHKVSAIYPSREEAEAVRQRLIDGGIGASAVDVLHDHSATVVEEGSDEVLKDMLVDGAVGTAVGTGVGALGTAALWASGITLFVASPVVAPLAMLGWFAGIGGLVGAATGAHQGGTLRKEGKFSELVMDAIKSGNAVLVARTHDKTEREVAKKIIGDSLKGRDEVASESD